jgi:REP element-mobilizing transposase RayT
MSQSLSNVLLHVIFSTKERYPFIREEQEQELFAYLATACRSMKCPALKVGGYDDHVHILCKLARTVKIADLLEAIKADSSKWMKTRGELLADFSWQNGYGAFSIAQSQVPTVKRYIDRQRQRHRSWTYQDEFRGFLKRYEIDYDERYVWD